MQKMQKHKPTMEEERKDALKFSYNKPHFEHNAFQGG